MIINASSAATFIDSYQKLLAIAAAPIRENEDFLKTLVRGRRKIVEDASALDAALAELKARSVAVDHGVVDAVTKLRVDKWIYLRDTRAYSVFLDPASEAAYGVLGLTDRIRDLVGDSGAIIEAGLLPYEGRILCDNLISVMAWLGRGYRKSFTERLAELRAAGAFTRTDLA